MSSQSAFVTQIRARLERGFVIEIPHVGSRRVEARKLEEETDEDIEFLNIEFQLHPPISPGPPVPEPVFLFTFSPTLSVDENFGELEELVLANPNGIGELPVYHRKSDWAHGD